MAHLRTYIRNEDFDGDSINDLPVDIELTNAVISNDVEKVISLLSGKKYGKQQILQLLAIALAKGHRKISNFIIKEIEYDLSIIIPYLEVYKLMNIPIDQIVYRLLDVFEHNNIVPKYEDMEKLLNLLDNNTDQAIVEFFEYYLFNVDLTKKQYASLLEKAKQGTKTFNFIKHYTEEKTRL